MSVSINPKSRERRGRCPHRPAVKPENYMRFFGEFVTFYIGADVGIGPYDCFFDSLRGALLLQRTPIF